jgi:hypothetical protein
MRDATEQEVAKVCFLVGACGETPENAKAQVQALRRKPDTANDKISFGTRLPEEWFCNLREELTNLSNSELLRYTFSYVVDDTHEEALSHAKRTRGPKPKVEK